MGNNGRMAFGKLVLLRHGQSEWNASNQFTGWVDVDLTPQGREEAVRGGQLLAEAGVLPDVLYTSLLRRAITTTNIALDAADRHWIPVVRDWRLNERHYGKLQGLNKAEIKEEFGDEQFMLWRRSYDTPPPEIAADDKYSQVGEARYADLDEVPLTECLLDVVKRFIPYYEAEISDEAISELNIPTGIPLVYEFSESGEVANPGGTYLDPEAAAAGAAAVANQGGK